METKTKGHIEEYREFLKKIISESKDELLLKQLYTIAVKLEKRKPGA